MTAPASISEWYEALLDVELGKLATDQERYSFLIRQGNIWQQRYSRFVCTDGRSESKHPQFGYPTAFDFLSIVTGIDRRKGLLESMRVAS